jgi:hypothetical protein
MSLYWYLYCQHPLVWDIYLDRQEQCHLRHKRTLWCCLPLSKQVSLAISVEKMPQWLLKFICWLIDEKAYKAAPEPYTVPIDKFRKILGITESIVSHQSDPIILPEIWLKGRYRARH